MIYWQQEFLAGGGDCLSDEHGLGLFVHNPLSCIYLVLSACFGDLGLGMVVGCYDRSNHWLYRGHTRRSIGTERLVLCVGCDKAQMSHSMVIVGAWNADGIEV